MFSRACTFERSILIGHDVRTKQPIRVPFADLNATSMHIVGGSGYGKSYLLRQIIDQFIQSRAGFGAIDPHGELVEFAMYRLRRVGYPASKIILLNPKVEDFSLAFNPFYAGVSDVGDTASMVLAAFIQSWGAASMDATPRLEGLLRGLIHLLIASRLSLAEAYDVLNPDNVALRRVLRDRLDNEVVRSDWLEFEKLSKGDKLTLVESTRNRVRRLIHASSVMRMLAQTEHTVDVKRAMDEGRIVLVSLDGLPRETQRLLGALAMNAFYQAGQLRSSRRRRPFYLCCDEFAEYVTPDVAAALDQCRKRGLHLVLAHQRLHQLERDSPDILSAVLTNCKIRIVMGGLSRRDAEIAARELFTGSVHGSEVKHINRATKFRPVLDTFEVETESESASATDGESESTGSSSTEGRGESSGRSWREDPTQGLRSWDDPFDASVGESTSSAGTTSSNIGRSRTAATSSSRSRSTVPITRHEEFIEETGRQFISVDDQWERRTGLVAQVPKRVALVRTYHNPVIHMHTADVEPERIDARHEAYRLKVLRSCPEVLPAAEVDRQIEARRRDLKALAETAEADGRPFDVRSFRGA